MEREHNKVEKITNLIRKLRETRKDETLENISPIKCEGTKVKTEASLCGMIREEGFQILLWFLMKNMRILENGCEIAILSK